eukprot:966901-Rhodomonas_salina.1
MEQLASQLQGLTYFQNGAPTEVKHPSPTPGATASSLELERPASALGDANNSACVQTPRDSWVTPRCGRGSE